MRAAIARALEFVILALPGVLVAPVAEILGTLAYLLSPRARRAVRANLATIAPLRTSARRPFVHQARAYLETLRLTGLGRAEIRELVDVAGFERFEEAYAAGRGVIVASAHLGPVALCGQVISARGYDITAPIEPDRSAFDAVLNRARRSLGVNFVPTDTAFGIGRVLRRGGVLGIMADRAVTGVGERVEFFGRPALLPSVHVALALRTGAPILPAFAHRRNGRYVAQFEPALHLVRTADREADVREGVRRFAIVLEKHIRTAPEEWAQFEPIHG